VECQELPMDRNAKDAQILEQYNSQYKGLAAGYS
jgi:hypothetical protein